MAGKSASSKQSVDRRVKWVLAGQITWMLLAGLAALVFADSALAAALSTGAAIAGVNTGLLAWRMRNWSAPPITRSPQGAHSDQGAYSPQNQGDDACERMAHRHLKQFYRYTLERYGVVGGLLALSLGGFKFLPLGLLSGFIVGQMLWLLAPLLIKET